jgi:prevent-host-death family protein
LVAILQSSTEKAFQPAAQSKASCSSVESSLREARMYELANPASSESKSNGTGILKLSKHRLGDAGKAALAAPAVDPMSIVTALEAKTRFGELLDRVARGEEIVITRHDKPVARIVPEGRPSLDKVRRAVQSMRALRAEMAQRKGFKPLTDKEITDSINEGRR